MPRPLTLEQAKATYVHRYTMEHVPTWAKGPVGLCRRKEDVKQFYAPQYRTDEEWYERTFFPGEEGCPWDDCCLTTKATFPLGTWLDTPFTREVGHAMDHNVSG